MLLFFFALKIALSNANWAYEHPNNYSFGIQGQASLSNFPPFISDTCYTKGFNNSDRIWLFGGSYLATGLSGVTDNLWKYENSIWTWMSGSGTQISTNPNYPRPRVACALWEDINGDVFLFGGLLESTTEALNDLWKFSPSSSTWTFVKGTNVSNDVGNLGNQGIEDSSVYPMAIFSMGAWQDINGVFWLYGGCYSYSLYLDNMWSFNGANWTWVSGSGSLGNIPPTQNSPGSIFGPSIDYDSVTDTIYVFGGVTTAGYSNQMWMKAGVSPWVLLSGVPGLVSGYFGIMGVSSPNNYPGGIIGQKMVASSQQRLIYVWGGFGYSESINIGWVQALWAFDMDTYFWTWLRGSNLPNALAFYGPIGVPGPSFNPTGFCCHVFWIDSSDKRLWLFNYGELWRYELFELTTGLITTAPATTAPVTTAPVTTAPVTTAPVTTAPVTTAPVTTGISITSELLTSNSITTGRVMLLTSGAEFPIQSSNSENLDTRLRTAIITASSIGSVIVVIAIVAMILFAKKMRVPKQENNEIDLPNNYEELPGILLVDIEIIRKIGKGNYGEVYRGKWAGVNVALKKLIDNSQWVSFSKEASVLCKLRHPNCVSFLGTFISEAEERFLVMEWMDMGSLYEHLTLCKTGGKTLYPKQFFEIINGLLNGMFYLEQMNIVHRDLACRNILVEVVNEEYRVKISDFGLAREMKEGIYKVAELGNIPIRWTAPEAMENKQYSSKSDVWSFAVTVWEIFSYGELPYGSLKGIDLVDAILKGEVLPQPSNCPAFLYTILTECWTLTVFIRPSFKELLERFQTSNEFQRGLTTYAPTEEIEKQKSAETSHNYEIPK